MTRVGIFPVGMAQHGITPELITPDVITPYGTAPDGITPDGIALAGFTSFAIISDGISYFVCSANACFAFVLIIVSCGGIPYFVSMDHRAFRISS